ncbi:MAG TPA: zinc ribbon domain-containing protein [Roseiflexaceae bacterium]|jgi:hypothetical protein|nr:zinc ribbon domain-containing protein [Roseiflexaceae bacterium]
MMVERICPACQQGNSLNDRFCGKCGTPLERQLPVRAGEGRLVIAGRQLPVTWGQFGRTVALSAAALAAEVGLTWLRRRMDAAPAPNTQKITRVAPTARAEENTALAHPQKGITIVSERVVDVWDNGDGHRRVVERSYWRRTEE